MLNYGQKTYVELWAKSFSQFISETLTKKRREKREQVIVTLFALQAKAIETLFVSELSLLHQIIMVSIL